MDDLSGPPTQEPCWDLEIPWRKGQGLNQHLPEKGSYGNVDLQLMNKTQARTKTPELQLRPHPSPLSADSPGRSSTNIFPVAPVSASWLFLI